MTSRSTSRRPTRDAFGREKLRQLLGTVTDTEYRPAGLQGDAGVERPGVNRVESEPIDEAHDRGHRDGVIAGRSQGETIRRAPAVAALAQT